MPVADVVNAFESLVDTMPNVEHVAEVVTYFKHTYVRGKRMVGRGQNYAPPLFPHDIWNQHAAAAEGIARTNNSCEGWHHGIQSLLQCNHPTMWRFIEGLKQDSAVQLASYLQCASGVVHPSQKRYRILRDRTQRALSAYAQTDILTFLRSIAFLSHS